MCAWQKQRSQGSVGAADIGGAEHRGRSRDELDFWINAVGSPLLVVERRSLVARSGNRGASVMFGVDADAFDGVALSDLVGPEANQMLGQIWSNAPVGVTGEPFLIRALVRDSERLLMVQVSKIVVEQDEFRLFSFVDAPPPGSVALAGWQEKIIDVLNWLPFGFEISTTDEQIQFANSQFGVMFGYSQHEIENIDDWFRLAYPDPEYRAYARSKWENEIIQARIEKREMTPFDLDVRTASGKDRTIQFRHMTVGEFNVNLYLDVTSERAAARDLKRLSEIDPLTGVMNRRHFLDRAAAAWSLGESCAMAVLVLDLDNFKSINDRLGHSAGDIVLKEFTRRCDEAVGDAGLFARFGGEEFVLLLHDSDPASAMAVAEHVRVATNREPFMVHGAPVAVSVSIGLAIRQPAEQLEQSISRADEALYRAKHAGRNQTVAAGDPAGEPIASGQLTFAF